MSEHTQGSTQCEEFQEDLTAIALGILSGRRRSEVLSHVEKCPQCSSELEHLSMVADAVLQLAPEEEPPVGFELRLAQRLQASAIPRRPTRLRRLSTFAIAAAVIVVMGFGVGTLVGTRSSNNGIQSTVNLASAALSSHGQNVGEVFVSAGKPAWMFMTVDSGSWSGAVTCELILANGKVETIGQFGLSGGYGAWGAPLTSSAGQVRSAKLITANGSVLASAHFPA
jgi:anti-sigma factor RsiW